MGWNGSGSWNSPAGNPVSSGTVITSTWANTLVTDLQNTFNNALPRDGQAPMTAALKLVDGSVTIPGLSFNSDSSTGLYRPSANNFAITVSGVELFRGNSGGRLLIGTTSDDGVTRLQVSGSATISSTLAVGGAAATTAALEVVKSTSIHQVLRSTSNTGYASLRLYNDQNSNARALEIDYSGSAFAGSLISGGPTGESAAISTTGAFPLVLGTNNTARATIDSSGNVGIGATPTAKLDVFGGYQAWRDASYTAYLGKGSTLVGTGAAADTALRVDGGNLLFVVGGSPTERARIDTSGNVGIGITPTVRFQVNGTGNVALIGSNTASSTYIGLVRNSVNYLYIGNGDVLSASGSTSSDAAIRSDTGSVYITTNGVANFLKFDTTGNLGINTAPSVMVHAKGSAATPRFRSESTTGTVVTEFTSDGSSGYGQLGTNTNHPLMFYTNSTERVRIDTSGKVGIGITPSQTLSVFANPDTSTATNGLRVATNNPGLTASQINNTAVGLGAGGILENNAGDLHLRGFWGVVIDKRGGNASSGATNTVNADSNTFAVRQTLTASTWENHLTVNGTGQVDVSKGSGKLLVGGSITRFESAEQACPTTTGNTTVAHGGPRTPDIVQVVLRCKTTEGGYAVGTEYAVTNLIDISDTSRQTNTSTDATNVVWRYIGAGITPAIRNTSGTLIAVTAASWKVVVKCLWL